MEKKRAISVCERRSIRKLQKYLKGKDRRMTDIPCLQKRKRGVTKKKKRKKKGKRGELANQSA